MSHLVKHLLELVSHMNLHSALQWRMIKNLLPHWGVLILLLHWGVNKWEMAKIRRKLLDQSSACTPGFAVFGRSMCERIGLKDSG